MTNFVCICTRRQIPGILSSSVFASEICHFCVDFYTISLFHNFCYNVHLWMNYGCALFHDFWKPLSRFFGRVFMIALRGWFAPKIFPELSGNSSRSLASSFMPAETLSFTLNITGLSQLPSVLQHVTLPELSGNSPRSLSSSFMPAGNSPLP